MHYTEILVSHIKIERNLENIPDQESSIILNLHSPVKTEELFY